MRYKHLKTSNSGIIIIYFFKLNLIVIDFDAKTRRQPVSYIGYIHLYRQLSETDGQYLSAKSAIYIYIDIYIYLYMYIYIYNYIVYPYNYCI